MVLGAHWLHTLGLITWDFTQLVMQFTVSDCVYTLVGDNSATVMFMDSKMMNHTLKQECYVILLHLRIDDEPISSPIPVDVVTLIYEFADIFAIPSTLPSIREHDHRIYLDLNVSPVNVRPYHYPYFKRLKSIKLSVS